jgi:hypothetical protein
VGKGSGLDWIGGEYCRDEYALVVLEDEFWGNSSSSLSLSQHVDNAHVARSLNFSFSQSLLELSPHLLFLNQNSTLCRLTMGPSSNKREETMEL